MSKITPIFLLCMTVLMPAVFKGTFVYISVLPQLIFFFPVRSLQIPVWVHCQLLYANSLNDGPLSGVTGLRKASSLSLCSMQALASQVLNYRGGHSHLPENFVCKFIASLSGNCLADHLPLASLILVVVW